ncbi:MAG TPA: 23S rRNA (guanosine(2251)-2'-O)-methyltransferase RlmB [Bacteroidota bacterium]|nr:23S rRNA (guanosine(2251)-2'-O)-methyltransferase RlmB [Bacteroidota bacterium]
MNVIVGRHPVIEALRSGTLIEKILISKTTHGEALHTIRQMARERNILCVDVQAEKLGKYTDSQTTQGIVAIVGEKAYCEVEDILAIAAAKKERPFILIFDEIEDPHNLGALIRSAVCTGAHGGIIPKHNAASVTETVAKTSAGASAHFPIAKVTNIAQTIDELKHQGVWIVGTEIGAKQTFMEIDYTMPVAIVVGNEGRGMRRLVKEKCDFLVSIPMRGSLDSFNASVAGALLMYEVLRRRYAK